jgi:bacterioferritin (cytochrome b1)
MTVDNTRCDPGPAGPAGPTGVPALTLPAFLDVMNSDLQNEWTHLAFYLYHASAITGLHAAEYREFFTDAAKGEMQHVQMFLDRLYGLNYAQPTQTGHEFSTFTHPADALTHAIELEAHVAQNYATRLKQLEYLADAFPVTARYLTVFYEDQLKDSYEDCERMRRLMADDLRQILRNTRHDPEKFLAT